MDVAQIPVVEDIVLLEKWDKVCHPMISSGSKVVLVKCVQGRSRINQLRSQVKTDRPERNLLVVAVLDIHICSLLDQERDYVSLTKLKRNLKHNTISLHASNPCIRLHEAPTYLLQHQQRSEFHHQILAVLESF